MIIVIKSVIQEDPISWFLVSQSDTVHFESYHTAYFVYTFPNWVAFNKKFPFLPESEGEYEVKYTPRRGQDKVTVRTLRRWNG